MSDSFLDLLESSLEVPDFDLGDARRDALLAAAGGAVKAPDNVVPFPVVNDDEQAAFDWLMGERSADVPLMDRLVSRPEFFAAVVAQHGFLRELRAAMRIPAAHGTEQVAAVPGRGRRVAGILAGAVAAAFALMLVPQVAWKKSGGTTATVVSGSEGKRSGASTGGSSSHGPTLAHPVATPLSSQAETPASAVEVPVVARSEQGGSTDTAPEGITPVYEWKEALVAAAREEFGGAAPSFATAAIGDASTLDEQALAFGGRARSADGGSHEGFYAMTSDAGYMRNGWYHWAGAGDDGNSLTVPEPGGCLPVMVGCLLLWWRKRPAVRA
ncbi:MAG: hypothetical protein QM755_15660 [Luteolibacter sp.]